MDMRELVQGRGSCAGDPLMQVGPWRRQSLFVTHGYCQKWGVNFGAGSQDGELLLARTGFHAGIFKI
jgi:hypothetical protein